MFAKAKHSAIFAALILLAVTFIFGDGEQPSKIMAAVEIAKGSSENHATNDDESDESRPPVERESELTATKVANQNDGFEDFAIDPYRVGEPTIFIDEPSISGPRPTISTAGSGASQPSFQSPGSDHSMHLDDRPNNGSSQDLDSRIAASAKTYNP